MRLKHFLSVFLTLLTLSVGQMWGAVGDELANCQGTGSGYGTRRTLTDSHSIGWVLSTGQSGYLGTNNATNHGKVVPTNADLPVVKAQLSTATTSTTGYYFYYTSSAISNVGSIVFSHSGTNSNASAAVYVVYSSTAAAASSATWEKVTLASTSTSAQGASVKNASGGTYTFTFNATQTSAKYYGVIIAVSGAQRFTAGTISIKEGATSQCTNPTTALSVSSSASATVGTPMTLTTANGNGGPVTWEITSGGDKATLDGATLTPTADGSVTVKATQDDYTTGGKTYCGGNASKTITITKASASITLSALGATSSVSGTHYGGDSYTLPTTTTATCTGKVFVGWSRSEIEETDIKPTSNFYAKGEAVTLTAGSNTFYAVFAKAGTPVDASLSASYSSHTGWTETDCCGSSFWVLCTGASLTSPVIEDLSTVSSITLKVRTYGGANYNTVTVKTSSNETVGSADHNNTTLTNKTINVSGLTGTGSLVFTGSAATASYGPGMDDITINYKVPSYTKYATSCCTELGQINGAVDLTQLAEGVNAGKLQATWPTQSNTDGWAANGIQVNIYEEGNATPVVTSAALANNITSFTASDFTPKTCTNYYATLTALHGDDASYCAGNLVSNPSENVTTAGYTYVNNSTNVNLVAALPASTCANGGADVNIQFTAAAGYRLPSTDEEIDANVSVTNAGVKDEDWSCGFANDVLTITVNPTKATGNIGIKVDGIETVVPEISVSKDEIDFDAVKKGVATSTTFTVEGANLSNNITLSSDEEAFTLSTYSLTQEDGAVALTTITLTANTATAGEYMGTITISDGNEGATDKSIDVYLTVLETYTVNWFVNGTKVHEQTDVANTAYDEVPSDFSAFTDCADLHFVGWKEGAIDGGSTTSAPSLANIGSAISAANKNYYAVFAEGTPGSTNELLNETFDNDLQSDGTQALESNDEVLGDFNGATSKAYKGANGTIKFGTSNNAGYITSKQLDLSNAFTVSLKAKYYSTGGDNASVQITVGEQVKTISKEELTNEFKPFSFNFDAATSTSTIKIGTDVKRAYIDDVLVTQEVAANWTKWYTTCPHTYIVALSPATNGNGTISFAKNASAITEIETTGEAATVDVVAAPATGYELTGVALSSEDVNVGQGGASYSNNVITIPANEEGTLTATATFSKANYAVTYTAPSNGNYTIKVGDAAAVSTNTTAQHEQTITLAVASVTEGYQFIGWTVTKTVGGAAISVDGNNQFTMPAEAVTVAANFQEIPAVAYTVTFSQGDHGTCTESSLEEESAGAGVTLPSCNATTGYAFLGWTATENKTTVDEGLTAGALYRPEEDITLYAVYKQLKAVTLKKRDNSGTDVVLYEDVATGKVTLPARTCKNNDYSFAGWSQTYYSTEQEDADAVIFVAGEYTPTGNITLYPVFSRGSESYAWTKITDLSTVTEGTYALVSTADYAFNGTMSSGHGQKTATEFAFTDGVAEEAPEGTCILEFQAVTEEEVVVGYKMYNETNGYLYASAASSGKLAWHESESSYWKYASSNWVYNSNSAYLRVYDNTFRTYAGSSNNALAVAKKTTVPLTLYLAAPANVVTVPTFDPVAGAYYGAQNVTISSETNDVTIYYTEDGSVPSNESTEFTGAFSVSSSKTIKAIAIDEDGYSSTVAEAAYTIYPIYNSIAAYQAASAQEAATARVIINKEIANAIVIGVTGKYTYVQDGTAAMVIQRPNTSDPWTVGDELGGYLQGTRGTYYGLPMITVADVANVSASEGTPITAQTVSNLDFAGAWNSYAGNLIKVSDVYFQAQATSDRIVALTDGAEHTGAIYDALFKIDGANLPLTATACDVTGILVARTDNEVTTHYIAPTALTDISTKGAVAQLNVSPVGGADAEHAVGIALGGQVTVTPVDGFATTLNSEEISTISTVDVTGPTSITVSASRQFYTGNNQTYYYDVDDSYMPVTVTQPANAGGSTIEANLTSAQEGNAITLNYNLAEHYHFNGWNVYKTGDAETTVTVTNNQFNMPAYAVTVEADIEEDAYATVVFDGNGATGDAPAGGKKYVGQEVTMPSKGALVKADHVLASWTYNETDYEIGDTYVIQAGDAAIGGKDITFTANWTPYPWANGGDWMLVTDAAEVTAGSYVIIAAAESAVAMSTTQNNNNRAQQSISKSDNRLTYETAPAIFEVRAGNKENTLAFYDVVNEGYIYAASSSSNYLRTETTLSDNSSWNVEILNTGVAKMQAQGTYSRDKLQYNSNDNLFSCYGSFDKASVVLYKYYAPVPKVTYDKNTTDEVTNMPNPSVQRAENNKAVIAAGPSRTGYTFEGWKNGNTTYTVGEEYTFTEDITLYAQWEALPSFHVTYNTSGSQGTTPTDATNYYEGDEVTLASASGLSNAGYFFDQWVATYVDNNSVTQTLVIEDGKFTMPAFNVTLTATWARKSSDKWIKVTATSQLAADKEYIIVNTDATYAVGAQNNNNRAAAAIEENNGILTISDAVAKFTLGIPETDNYTFYQNGTVDNVDKGYLYAASSSSNYMKTQTENDANGVWTISIGEEGAATVTATGTITRNIMRYNPNNGSPMFSCYASTSTVQNPVVLYYKAPKIEINDEQTVNVSDAAGADIVIHDGGTLTVDDATSIGDLTVETGGNVTLSSNKLTVVGKFTIETTMAGGNSGQLEGATASNFAAGEAYIDITLGAGGTNQQWHAFTVPFPVDVMNGIYDLDGNKLTNEVNYAIMEYHGDIRATGAYGWKKIRTTLVPGTFYIMATDGYRTTYRFKKKAGAALVAENSKEIFKFAASGDGVSTDAGWNGVGNPTLTYGKVGVEVQVLDPESYTFIKKDANSTNFVVGTPFFYQAAAAGSISMLEANAGASYAPRRVAANGFEKIKVAFGNEEFTDYLDVSASEEALNEYQIGKDLAKMTMTNTPKVAQIFGKAYNTKLCMVHAPMVNDQAEVVLELYAPQAGTYTISVPTEREDASLYLTKDGNIIWDLTMSPYEAEFDKGATEGYGLMLVRKAPQVTTGVENVQGDKTQCTKVILNDHVYILRDGQLYDVTGKAVK